MIVEGRFLFEGPRETVYRLLQDPEVLAKALPGAKSLERVGEARYQGVANVGVGPVTAGEFSMIVEIRDTVPPESFTMQVDGKGSIGYTRGSATVTLTEESGGTVMVYRADLQVGGKIAGVGQRLLDTASKAMTRPPLGNLSPGSVVSVSGNNRTVTAGNPLLDPFESDNYDLGFEWYFADESLVALALFYKDIGSFIQTIRSTMPFTGNPLGLPDSVAIAACGTTAGCTPDADWNFNLPANTPGGEVEGFEISYQQPFTFLPGALSGFGVILNYTGVESDVQYLDATGAVVTTANLAGLSESAYNATLYFENDRFSARVSAAYRDEYLTTVPGRNGNDVEGTAETLNVDAAASFSLNDNIEFTLEALNLTDEFQDQWVDSNGNRLSYYHHTGREYFLGARFRF